MSTYILLAVKVPIRMEEGLDTGDMIRERLEEEPWVEEVFLLNTIPAPGSSE